MTTLGFIGSFDKTDMLLYLGKVLTAMGKKILIVDATVTQKARYVVPTISPAMSYITEFEEMDVAVGFNGLRAIAGYLNKPIDNLSYDYIFLDIDTAEQAINFQVQEAQLNFFVTSFDTFDIRRGLDVLNALPVPLKMYKVLFAKEVFKEDDDYLNYLSLGSKVIWQNERIYFPLEQGDKTAIINNQKASKIRFSNLTQNFRDGLAFMALRIAPDIPQNKLMKVFKEN